MRKCGSSGHPASRMPVIILLLFPLLALPGCTDLSADDAEGLFAQALDIIRDEQLRLVPAEPAAPAMIVRSIGPIWQPFADVNELGRQVRAVTLADGSPAGRETVLCIELEPEAAKTLLEQRLRTEMEAVRQDSGIRPDDRIRARMEAAERQLATKLSAARVEMTLYLRVDRGTARPSDLHMETNIIQPAGLHETLSDFFVFV